MALLIFSVLPALLGIFLICFFATLNTWFQIRKRLMKNIDNRNIYIGTFADFKKEFLKREWRKNGDYDKLLVSERIKDRYAVYEEYRSILRTESFKFSGTYMTMSYLDYMQAMFFIHWFIFNLKLEGQAKLQKWENVGKEEGDA